MAERVTEIYSLLVPLCDGRLIIPRACVAEVVGFQTPSEMTGAPPWYIGTVPWNGKAVPLVSFEGACGQMIPPASGRSRAGDLPGSHDKRDATRSGSRASRRDDRGRDYDRKLVSTGSQSLHSRR